MAHLADGSARYVAEIQETREARRSGAPRGRGSDTMKVLYVDLEREWRGGQSQALLPLCGSRQRGHEVELFEAPESPLAIRASGGGMNVHQGARCGLRAWASPALRDLLA